MIIIEGPDGAGKSTLAKYIQSLYPEYIITHSPGPCPKEVFKERIFWNLEMSRIKNIIVDRVSIISEVIYGETLRGESYITEQNIRDFFGKFYRKPFNILIYCSGYFGEIKKESGALYLEKKEKIKFEEKVSENLEKINKAYKDFFKKWINIFQNVHFFELDGNFKSYIKLNEKLKEILQ